jgi:carbamate kinase
MHIFNKIFSQQVQEIDMDDPRIHDVLSLMLDEMRENRKGIQRLEVAQERQEILLQRQADTMEQFFRIVASPQATQIVELETKHTQIERRLEILQRKIAA